MNEIYGVITELVDDKRVFDEWYAKMPQSRRDKIDRIKPLKDKKLSLCAGIALFEALSDLGIKDYEVITGEQGKPCIKGREDIFFNLSHAGNMAVCAISDSEVGVDIEAPRSFSEKLIKKVFDENEIRYVCDRESSKEKQDELYTFLWTIKESVMKYYGVGIAMEPSSIHINPGEKISVKCDGHESENLNIFFNNYMGIMLTICSKNNNFTKVINIIK